MEDALRQGGCTRRTDMMPRAYRQSGLTLTEMAVVTAIIGLLVALGIPAVRTLMHSFEFESGAKTMIDSALASAKALAIKNQRYAGIRLQPDAEGRQYMIFIIHDPAILARGFRTIPGTKPIALPESVGVADLRVRSNRAAAAAACTDTADEPVVLGMLDDGDAVNLSLYGVNTYILDTRTFSVIFSPAGKLVRQEVRVRNRHGIYQPDNGVTGRVSDDEVFNSPVNIADYGVGTFIQDDYADLGFGAEWSRNGFVIYDRTRMKDANAQERFGYLLTLPFVSINPYTAAIVSTN